MANLEVSIGANPEQLGRDLNRAQNMINNFVNHVQKISEIGDALSNLGQKITLGITLPILGLGAAAIKAYGDIEALQKGLEAVMGSAARASGEFDKLREVAKLPGLGLKEAAQGSVALQSAGFSAKKSREALLSFGNALATVGKGANEMNFVILALTQLHNKATGFGQDLRQLMEQLPQLRGALEAAFGTSDSEAIAKTGATGAEVVEKLIKEFAKLPKVTGGIKNAFENLKDSIFINLSKIGDAINKNFNISKIIDKLTGAMDKLVSAFEDLSPGMQKAIIVSAGLVAVVGPLLVGFGGLLAIIPSIVTGIGAMITGWKILTVVMTSAAGVIGLLLLGATALGAGIVLYAKSIETASDRTERFEKSQAKATATAQIEISALDTLYSKTQNLKLSIEERKAAVDALQKQYPGYFQNIKDEIILNGKAKDSYLEVRKAIFSASLARAAQSELDKRNEKRLNKELEIRKRINAAVEAYKNPTQENFEKFRKEVEDGFLNFDFAGRAATPEQIKELAKQQVFGYVKELKKNANAYAKEDNPILDIIKSGQDAINKLEVDFTTPTKPKGPAKGTIGEIEERIKKLQEYRKTLKPLSAELIKTDAEIKRLSDLISKPKSTEQKQLAEIFPKGSIDELKQRGELLKKAIESTSGDLIKLRKLDKFGHDKDKNGNPYYSGEVLTRQKANEELENINKQIKDKEYKNFEERISNAEKYYDDYDRLSDEYGKKIADNQYSKLIDGSKNFVDWLDNEKSALQSILDLGGVLTEQQKADLKLIDEKLLERTNIRFSKFDKFKNDVDEALSKIPLLADKLLYLDDLEKKEHDNLGNSKPFTDRFKYLNDQYKNILKQQKEFYATYLNDNRTFEQKKIDVEKQYDDVRDKLNKDKSLSLAERLRLIKESYKLQTEAIQASINDLNKAFSSVLNQTIVDGISNAMASIGDAFGNGTNIIQSIGLSLLSTLGSVMIDLGKMAISTGIGLLAITTALKSLNPYVAIAAGAALVALGSIVKGGVSKIGNSMSSGGSGGSVSTGTGANYSGNTYSSNYSTGGSGGGGEVIFRISGSDLVGALNRAISSGNRLNS